jgi:hypothetical protein
VWPAFTLFNILITRNRIIIFSSHKILYIEYVLPGLIVVCTNSSHAA